jgi:hypothetical protein
MGIHSIIYFSLKLKHAQLSKTTELSITAHDDGPAIRSECQAVYGWHTKGTDHLARAQVPDSHRFVAPSQQLFAIGQKGDAGAGPGGSLQFLPKTVTLDFMYRKTFTAPSDGERPGVWGKSDRGAALCRPEGRNHRQVQSDVMLQQFPGLDVPHPKPPDIPQRNAIGYKHLSIGRKHRVI